MKNTNRLPLPKTASGFTVFPVFLSMVLLLNTGCSLEKLGNSAARGVSLQSDSIGNALVRGAVTQLTDPATQQKIRKFVDSLLASAADTLNGKVQGIRDSLLNQKLIAWADSLVEAVTGTPLNANLERIQATLIGKTKQDVFEMKRQFDHLLTQILSNDTKGKLGAFRDELLGDKTNAAITRIADTLVSHIVDSALVHLTYRYHTELDPEIRGDIGFINKNAKSLLLVLGLITCGIILLVWRSRTKYLRLTTLLTKQINAIPDQNVYDKVTANIKNDALTAGLEVQLRELLIKNGLLGTTDWQTQTAKLN